MSRYIRETELNQPIDVVSMLMEDFVYHNQFTRADWNGEMVYFLKDKHGKERYMKWYYTDGVFRVEAWIKGSFGNEITLDGAGGASKKEFRRSLDNLISKMKNYSANSVAGGHVGSDPLHHDSAHGTNHDSWKKDTVWQQGDSRREDTYKTTSPGEGNISEGKMAGGAAPENVVALILAVFAVTMGGFFPIFGIMFAVCAMKRSHTGRYAGLVKALSVLAIVFSVIGFLTSLFGGMAAFFFNYFF